VNLANLFRTNKPVLVPLAIGIGAGIVTIVRAITGDSRRVLIGWIAAYGLTAATVLAAMVLVMTLHLTGARWWLVLRPIFVAIAGTAPLLIPLFVPIGATAALVYPWSSPPPELPEPVSAALEHQRVWNHPAAFVLRSAIYLVTWTALAIVLRRPDVAATTPESKAVGRTERTASAIGLPVMALTITFAAFDWMMSLQPGWTSNMFGLYVFTSGLIAALAVISIGVWLASRSGGEERPSPDHAHAVGRLMLLSVILWAYIGFFQLLLVWIADIPHEVTFYDGRARGSWAAVSWFLVIGRFALPLLGLFSRRLKRSPALLACMGGWLFLGSVLDFAWLALPAAGMELGVLDFVPFVCIVALVCAYGVHLVIHIGTDVEHAPPEAAIAEALRYRSP
jgi:hypothetical protein